MTKYDNIKSMQDLDSAMANVRKRLALQEMMIRSDAESVRNSFTPRNVLFSGLGAATKLISFDKLLILGLGLMRRRLLRRKR